MAGLRGPRTCVRPTWGLGLPDGLAVPSALLPLVQYTPPGRLQQRRLRHHLLLSIFARRTQQVDLPMPSVGPERDEITDDDQL